MTFLESEATIPVVHAAAAEGTFSLLWLIIALPALGAAILLLGGRRTDAWGHILGVATVAGSFVLSVVTFVALLGRDGAGRHRGREGPQCRHAREAEEGRGILPIAALDVETGRGVPEEDDLVEGPRAFAEKRTPVFTGS